MYLTIHPYFDEMKTVLKYSRNEIVNNIRDIDHSIFHCVLNEQHVNGVEISSTADVPSGTGLGSSSSFTVGLLHTLACYKGEYVSKSVLAKEACAVEIEKLGAPIGKQDQYAAAFGGLNFIRFHKDDTVSVEPVISKGSTLKKLQKNLVMFYTGFVHNANEILSVQKKNISQKDAISGVQALIVSTATRVGMGNLVGVVAAISMGGAGAVFWMWIIALLGSSTAFAEGTLAQIYKEEDPLYGGFRGGPAYYIHHLFIKKGSKRKKSIIAALFALSGLICWCGISQVIVNSVSCSFGGYRAKTVISFAALTAVA